MMLNEMWMKRKNVDNYVESVESNVESSFLQHGKVENYVDNRGKCVNNKNMLWKNNSQQIKAEDMIV